MTPARNAALATRNGSQSGLTLGRINLQPLFEAEEHEVATSDIESEARDELLAAGPTTLAGTLALIRHVVSYGDGTNQVLKGPSHDFFYGDEYDFLTTIGDAIEAMHEGAVA
jgi:hypothetical protein